MIYHLRVIYSNRIIPQTNIHYLCQWDIVCFVFFTKWTRVPTCIFWNEHNINEILFIISFPNIYDFILKSLNAIHSFHGFIIYFIKSHSPKFTYSVRFIDQGVTMKVVTMKFNNIFLIIQLKVTISFVIAFEFGIFNSIFPFVLSMPNLNLPFLCEIVEKFYWYFWITSIDTTWATLFIMNMIPRSL